MRFLLVGHGVAEFDQWESAYDAHLPARQKAGLNPIGAEGLTTRLSVQPLCPCPASPGGITLDTLAGMQFGRSQVHWVFIDSEPVTFD